MTIYTHIFIAKYEMELVDHLHQITTEKLVDHLHQTIQGN